MQSCWDFPEAHHSNDGDYYNDLVDDDDDDDDVYSEYKDVMTMTIMITTIMNLDGDDNDHSDDAANDDDDDDEIFVLHFIH